MDWSLCRRKTKYPLLRSELAFKDAVWSYYAVVIIDILLRFSWVIYLAPKPDTQLQGFIVALIEMCRRILWNIYRVESEHTGNVDGYRVTRDVPLPYLTPRDASKQEALEGDGPDYPNGPTTLRKRIFGFLHRMHREVTDELRPLGSIRLPSFGRAYGEEDDGQTIASGKTAARKVAAAKDYERRKKSRGTAPESSSSEHDGERDDDDDDDDDDLNPPEGERNWNDQQPPSASAAPSSSATAPNAQQRAGQSSSGSKDGSAQRALESHDSDLGKARATSFEEEQRDAEAMMQGQAENEALKRT